MSRVMIYKSTAWLLLACFVGGCAHVPGAGSSASSQPSPICFTRAEIEQIRLQISNARTKIQTLRTQHKGQLQLLRIRHARRLRTVHAMLDSCRKQRAIALGRDRTRTWQWATVGVSVGLAVLAGILIYREVTR